MKKYIGRIFIGILIALQAPLAKAFPELIRHGYNSCVTCHLSPTGGGVLTEYGRALSSEVLSTWGSENETKPFWGAIPGADIEGLLLSGDYRSVQTFNENENTKSGKFIWMQASLGLAYRKGDWAGAVSFGQVYGNGYWRAYGNDYYLSYGVTELQTLRAGLFAPQFGIVTSNHNAPQKDRLAFGLTLPRNSLEWTGQKDDWMWNLTYSEAPKVFERPLEKAISVVGEKIFNDTYKVGVDFWKGGVNGWKREVLGLHALLGLNHQLYILGEEALQNSKESDEDSVSSRFGAYKVGYEVIKGLHLFLMEDHSQTQMNDSSTYVRRWGPGFQFFPRPHFEFSGTWTRRLVKSTSDKDEDYAWAQIHYYL